VMLRLVTGKEDPDIQPEIGILKTKRGAIDQPQSRVTDIPPDPICEFGHGNSMILIWQHWKHSKSTTKVMYASARSNTTPWTGVQSCW